MHCECCFLIGDNCRRGLELDGLIRPLPTSFIHDHWNNAGRTKRKAATIWTYKIAHWMLYVQLCVLHSRAIPSLLLLPVVKLNIRLIEGRVWFGVYICVSLIFFFLFFLFGLSFPLNFPDASIPFLSSWAQGSTARICSDPNFGPYRALADDSRSALHCNITLKILHYGQKKLKKGMFRSEGMHAPEKTHG